MNRAVPDRHRRALRPLSARILAYPAGALSIRGKVLTPGWDAVAGRQPRGSPVVMAVAADGSIWVTDDRSRAILRIARPD